MEILTDTEHMEILTDTEHMSTKEKHKVLQKLYKQFGHATVDRLQKLLSSSGNNDDEKYETGNKVYYKRVDCQEWKGPGVVIGQDGVVIFVRHEGMIVRVHHSRLRKVNDQQDRGAVAENQSPNENDKKDTVTDTNLPDVTSNDMDTETDTGNGAETFNHATGNTIEGSNEENIQQQPHVLREHGCSNLKTGQTVKYMDRESGIPYTATVIGRAGKDKGKHQNWSNLQYSEPATLPGTTGSADLSLVDNIRIESMENREKQNDIQNDDVLETKDVSFDSKLDELSNWRKNGVFEEVKDIGQKCVSTRWVCTLKESLTGIVPKARLVARGLEELATKQLPKDSPTCASESLRLLLTVICQKQWKLNSIDIKSAFLQGTELSRDIHIRPPPEAKSEGTLWKLKKCVYGLADGSLYCYSKVKATVLNTGGKMSQVDPAVFHWLDQDCNVTGVLACHVDDFIWGGSQTFASTVIPHLKAVHNK
ncbi:uncharacterized protein ACWYII_007190 [Salvelinus alpinus]